MQDFSQLLSDKVETIAQSWIDAVFRDEQIKSTDHLSRKAVEDHVADVLVALSTVLAKTEVSDLDTIAKASFQHGALRAEQDFDPTEVVREYHLLRSTIVAHLKTELLQGTPDELLRTISLIDMVVDAAISQCFKSYVEQRLQELEQVQSQLMLTVEELNRLVHVNQDSLSVLAHELKTPLTSIIGYSELFLRQQQLSNVPSNVRDTAPSLSHIEQVLRSGRLLLRLINSTLEWSRYEPGKVALKQSTVEVRSLIQTVIEVMQPLADNKGLQLYIEDEFAPDEVTIDALRLQQILTNLVSNAIRYTETGGITIKAHSLTSQHWLLSVTDTGLGISPEDQSRLFQPFARASLPTGFHPADSTGLGLAIVDRLVKSLQGEISLVSEPGKGSTFKVTFPIEGVLESDLLPSQAKTVK
ncbi:ATP-binding protein [Phormidesmis sp. 146-35]